MLQILIKKMLIFLGAAFWVGEKSFMKKKGRVHQCQVCPYTTYHSPSLKRHLRTHTGERPFACSFCSYRCKQKAHLKSHLMLKHHRSDRI